MVELKSAPQGAINLKTGGISDFDRLPPSLELGLIWQEGSDKKTSETRKRLVRKENMNPAKKRHFQARQVA